MRIGLLQDSYSDRLNCNPNGEWQSYVNHFNVMAQICFGCLKYWWLAQCFFKAGLAAHGCDFRAPLGALLFAEPGYHRHEWCSKQQFSKCYSDPISSWNRTQNLKSHSLRKLRISWKVGVNIIWPNLHHLLHYHSQLFWMRSIWILSLHLCHLGRND